ncbi:MAG: stage 0 sporulation protein [Erysipelotrichaceae bacterium]|nr:stage 0 sporulation protein [Erysipelotrichaceae bacterium]
MLMESKLVLVTLLSMGKTFYFKSEDESLLIDDLVICETTRGIELGKISGEFITREISEEDQYPVIIRKGNEEDYLIHEANLVLANEAIALTQAKSDLLKLEMNVVACEYMFDRTKVIIYYLAETRVDFRDLLKELANDLHCRIELRQIGARDKAKMIGGIGICGLKLCCTTFLNEFDGISITMAKNQMLALNIPKLSGQCGKLMCCLKYENDTYTEIQKDLPRVGSKAKYNGQVYKITSINIITKVCRLENHDGIVNVDYNDIKDHLLPRETPVSGGKNDN